MQLLLGRSVLFLVRRPLELVQWYWPNTALGGERFFCLLNSLTVEGRVTNSCSRLYVKILTILSPATCKNYEVNVKISTKERKSRRQEP